MYSKLDLRSLGECPWWFLFENHNEDSLVGEKHHLAAEMRKTASVVQKNYMDKTWFRL